jgi:hypothetical protein
VVVEVRMMEIWLQHKRQGHENEQRRHQPRVNFVGSWMSRHPDHIGRWRWRRRRLPSDPSVGAESARRRKRNRANPLQGRSWRRWLMSFASEFSLWHSLSTEWWPLGRAADLLAE